MLIESFFAAKTGLVSKPHLGWTLFLYVILLCVREDNLGEKQEKEGRRVNLKQRNTRGKVIVVFYSFHFCRWSVWFSMNEKKKKKKKKSKKEAEHKTCGKIMTKDKSTQMRELNEKWLP